MTKAKKTRAQRLAELKLQLFSLQPVIEPVTSVDRFDNWASFRQALRQASQRKQQQQRKAAKRK